MLFRSNDTATTEIYTRFYTLSLHDALPISSATLRQDAARLRDEASLWQAEAEARARAHGERQGALEERQARLAERDAQLRATRAEVARLAQTLSKLEMRCQEVGLRRTSLEEHVTDRYRDVALGSVVYDYHLREEIGRAHV